MPPSLSQCIMMFTSATAVALGLLVGSTLSIPLGDVDSVKMVWDDLPKPMRVMPLDLNDDIGGPGGFHVLTDAPRGE